MTNEQIVKAVLDLFLLNDGREVLVSEVAKAMGTSAARVNRAMNECSKELRADDKEVAYWDKNQYTTRYRLAPAVKPTTGYLVAMIKQTTRERDHLIRTMHQANEEQKAASAIRSAASVINMPRTGSAA